MNFPESALRDLNAFAARADEATRHGMTAYERLLKIGESSNSGQGRRVAAFVASMYNGRTYPLDPFEMRAVDVALSDDMLACLDALRWGRADLFTLVNDGDRRVRSALARWSVQRASRP